MDHPKLEEWKTVWRERRSVTMVYILLRISVVLVMLAQIFNGNFENVFLCVLTLILFMMPSVLEKKLDITLPNTLEIIILLFIFAAEILGELNSFYIRVPNWDTMLHTINGFLMAAIGFSMIDILNRTEKIKFVLSPVFVAVVAFCFSMTIGVLWEFFEFGMDTMTATDMQKDYLYTTVSTVYLNPENENVPVVIKDIKKTVIDGTVDGKSREVTIDGGYLDIGIHDTMKDLIVNFIGALTFSILGLFYIKNRGKDSFLSQFIPKRKR